MKGIYLVIVSLVLASCADHTLDSREYPRIHTAKVDVSPGSVVFWGTYLLPGKAPVTDHGFIWDVTYPDIRNSNKISLGPMDSPGDFSTEITGKMIAGHEYIVRAYAITSEYTVYGESITFKAE